ncbi:MAG: hypothetical protein JWL77_5271, partial [Chthonomonadaceae bacterium]|nr:hypothetical protein [Chthonomonadaceae bacterium]
ISLGQEKVVPFPEFRDMVRLAVRRSLPGAKIESTEVGFNIVQANKAPTSCNLRSLYLDYSRKPGDRERLINRWVSSLTMEVPDHTWVEAMMTLRPTLKPAEYLASAHRAMQRNTPPDSLPYAPFAGELSVIIMRELPGTVVGVTQSTLESWSVTYAEALKQAMNNMNMSPLPPVANALKAGGGGGRKKDQGEEVGLVFEGDHLTATWIIMERFRDYAIQRLQGDIVFSLPTRNRLVAIRADEPGLIQQIISSGRSAINQTHALTNQLFHVSAATTGGLVSVYQQGAGGAIQTGGMDPNSVFAHGGQAVTASSTPPEAYRRAAPVDLSSFGGLSESTGDDPVPGKGAR